MDLDNTWKFLKNINSMNKETYKTFAPLFESIKRKSKKRTWTTIKETIGSKKLFGNLSPKSLAVNDIGIFDKKAIAENFNNFFSKIGPEMAFKIPHSLISFEHFLHRDYPSLEEKPITDDEANEALQTLKTRKRYGYDEISSDVIKHISPSVFKPLRYILPDQLKIAKVTPLFKKGNNALMDNYSPILVLPCF